MTTMRSGFEGERGIALIQVLIVGAALFGLTTAALFLSRDDLMISNNVVNSTKAFWIAAGGTEYGKNWLEDSNNRSDPCLASDAGCDLGSISFADGAFRVTIARWAPFDPRMRITSVGTGPVNSRRVVEEIITLPTINGDDGLIQIDGAALPSDMERPGDGPGVRVPSWTIDGLARLPDGTVDPDCAPAPPVGGAPDLSNTGLPEELDGLRCRIVQRANECCLPDGTTNPRQQTVPGICVPGICGDETCLPGTCTLGTCAPGVCNTSSCVAGTCDLGTCQPGACAAGDPNCATGVCVIDSCTRGTCPPNGFCAAGTCAVGTCTPGTCAANDPTCVPGICRNNRCSAGGSCGNNPNCTDATCVVDLGSCTSGSCDNDNCTSGTCSLSSCSAGGCPAGSTCVAGACPVSGCAAGTECASGTCVTASCPAACSEGAVCTVDGTTCIDGTCGLPQTIAHCPTGLCESEPGLAWVRGTEANARFDTPYYTDMDLIDESTAPLAEWANWAADCDASATDCCKQMSLSSPELRPEDWANDPPRGPLVQDTPDRTDYYPVKFLSDDQLDALSKKIDRILDAALLAPAQAKQCITDQFIRGGSHFWDDNGTPQFVIVSAPNDSNPKMRALSNSAPCTTGPGDGVNNLVLKEGAVVQGSGILILPRELDIEDATFKWSGLIVILENGKIVALRDACGGICGALLLQTNNDRNNARLDFDFNRSRATCDEANGAFSINRCCDALDDITRLLMRTLSWTEIFS